MEQLGLTPRDLERYIGPSGRVSEVLNRKRRLSLRMVRRLHDGLKIPYETLLAAERMREAMQRAGEHAAAQGMNEATLDPLLADES
jgi:transcriptional regulator with XRE-family HTH domain